MQFFKYFLVAAICIALIDPTEGGWFRRTVKKAKNVVKNVGKAVKKVGKNIKKVGCKVLFGVGCPAAVGAAGTAIGAGSSGLGSAAVAAGVMAGTKACHVRKEKCKRSVSTTEIILPFSDDFRNYDKDGDKRLSYEEFVFAIMRSVDLADPVELREPFDVADLDEDGHLDEEEFHFAPFLFAHPFVSEQSASPAA